MKEMPLRKRNQSVVLTSRNVQAKHKIHSFLQTF